ncbi:GMC family oxidoreductase [Aquamicrobium sp. cd-1]|uniref:GMC family oxidoreductase n=2 Tax=Aquamicrobium zhengzhouense TaxID=2781738 RepID=A0ABS0S7I4_9HYPH|nr:GMC family oxidoreductase [Aquamicrobium zhengzhouense]
MAILSINSNASPMNYALAPYCIIGAGIAGLLIARRLCAAGRKVIVVESGGDEGSDDANQLNEFGNPEGRYTRQLTGRRRGLGGTSPLWGGRMIRLSPHETSARSHVPEGAWGIPLAELDAYESEIEALFKVASGSHEDLLSDAGTTTNEFPTDENSLIPRWAKCPRFKNCNIATLLKDELKRSPNIDIWLDATVCEFEVDRQSGMLNAVRARSLAGKELLVRAERFIFAAGSIETTRLLLLLNRQTSERAFSRCRVLGRYFQDHLKAQVAVINRKDSATTNRLFGYRFVKGTRRDLHLELAPKAQEREAVGSAFAYVAMDLDESPLSHVKQIAQGIQRREVDLKATMRLSSNMGLIARSAAWRMVRKQLYVPPDIDFRLMVCVEQLPSWNNRITLSRTLDALGAPRVHCDWGPNSTDERTFRAAVKAIDSYWELTGFKEICPLEWVTAAQEEMVPLIDISEACAHPSGSTRMGTDPATSVVGPDLHCHEVPNISVASASVFPSAGSANPTLTIMKLSLWLADQYLRQHSHEKAVFAVHAS